MKQRTEIIKDCLNRPFLIRFCYLGDYDDLSYGYITEIEAKEKMNDLINEAKKNNLPFFAEILKRITVETEE